MAKKYPGLYLYFDWMKGLEQLPCDVAMKIICNLYHYAEEAIEPEPLEELHYNILQNVYLDQIKRSKANQELGRKGGVTRVANADRQTAKSQAPSTPFWFDEYSDYADEKEKEEEINYEDTVRLYEAMKKGMSLIGKTPTFQVPDSLREHKRSKERE